VPDPRVGDRQRVCGKAECKKEFRRRTQAAWRERHPGYFIEWRARERAGRGASESVEPPRLAPPLSALPWELAQEEFGIAGADFLGSMGRLLVGHAKDETRSQELETTGETGKAAESHAKDERRSHPPESIDEFPQVGRADAKDEIRGASG
jgi:hypothetical protein